MAHNVKVGGIGITLDDWAYMIYFEKVTSSLHINSLP